MIENVVQQIKTELEGLNLFDELAGLVKPVPFKDMVLPFSCDLALDECKKGTEVAPSSNKKIVAFFERVNEAQEIEDDFCKSAMYSATVSLVVWYNCESITVINAGESIDCCQKQGFIQEKIINTIKGASFTSDIFANVTLDLMSFREYNFSKYQINERLKHHPYYAFEIMIPFRFILNNSCAGSLDIQITKEEC